MNHIQFEAAKSEAIKRCDEFIREIKISVAAKLKCDIPKDMRDLFIKNGDAAIARRKELMNDDIDALKKKVMSEQQRNIERKKTAARVNAVMKSVR